MNPLDIFDITKTTGQKLIDTFDLSELGRMSITIQKVFNSSKNIYIITYDSHYPKRIITLNDLRKINGNNLYKLKINSDLFTSNKMKLSMPVYLFRFNQRLSTNSYVITRDLMGRERYRNSNLFYECYRMGEDKSLIKL